MADISSVSSAPSGMTGAGGGQLLRITGMATGLDVDAMVKKMMAAEQTKLDKVKQQEQIIKWKQETYNDIIKDLTDFTKTYFQGTSDTNMLSATNYSGLSTSGGDSNIASITPGAGAKVGSYKVTVNNPAAKANQVGSIQLQKGAITRPPQTVNITDANKNITFTIDGDTQTITLDNGSYTLDTLVSAINGKISANSDLNNNGNNKVTANLSTDGTSVQFKKATTGVTNVNITYNGITDTLENYNSNNLIQGKIEVGDSIVKIYSPNNTINITVGSGSAQTITLAEKDYLTLNDLQTEIQNKLNAAGLSNVTASVSGNNIQFTDIGSQTVKMNSTTNNYITYSPAADNKISMNINGTSIQATLANGAYKLNGTDSTNDIIEQTLNSISNALNGLTTKNIAGIDYSTNGAGCDNNGLYVVDASNSKHYLLNIDEDATGYLNIRSLLTGSSDHINFSGSGLATLGFSSDNFEVEPQLTDKISSLFSSDVDKKVKFNINNVDFSYDFSSTGADKDKTITQVINDISSKAGVDITYSELSRQFTISSKNTGASQTVTLLDEKYNSGDATASKFLGILFGDNINPIDVQTTLTGKDASVAITDPSNTSSTIYNSSNNFNVDGVTYSVNPLASNGSSATITVSMDTDKVFNKIIGFIDKYNVIVDKVQTLVNQKKNYDYQPLTDEQKSSMKDADIIAWESKAKEGIVHNDDNLENLLTNLRRAFFDSVKDSGFTLTDLGLSTSDKYSQGGKIILDTYRDANGDDGEARLKKAIQNRGQDLVNLFTQQSTTAPTYNSYLTADQRTTRYNEEGILQRVNDIMQDNLGVLALGYNGILVDQANKQTDYSLFAGTGSTFADQIYQKENQIKQLNTYLSDKQEEYYQQFSKLETAMETLNAQQAQLSAFIGS